MRVVIGVLVPALCQLVGFALVILTSRGNGSFVGLLALSAAVVAIPGAAIVNFGRARKLPPIATNRLIASNMVIALIVPALLGVFRQIEPHI